MKIVREADKTTLAETARKHSITNQTIYRWRTLHDGMQVNGVKKLKGLRDENTQLKKLLTERDIELEFMKEINGKSSKPSRTSGDGFGRV